MSEQNKVTRKTARHRTEAFAIMFKHMEGWTVSAIEFRRESALTNMQNQIAQLPDFSYKVVPCEIWIAQHYLKSPHGLETKP